jgi:hypothetical protein
MNPQNTQDLGLADPDDDDVSQPRPRVLASVFVVRDAEVADESLGVVREESERRDENEQEDDVAWVHAGF